MMMTVVILVARDFWKILQIEKAVAVVADSLFAC